MSTIIVECSSVGLTLPSLSFVGPAMSDAITNLGGGGLSTPWLANLANSLSYTMSFFSTIIGGPIINKIGIKWACLIAAAAMPLHGSGYYVNARYKNDAYLLAANVWGFLISIERITLIFLGPERLRIWFVVCWRNHCYVIISKA